MIKQILCKKGQSILRIGLIFTLFSSYFPLFSPQSQAGVTPTTYYLRDQNMGQSNGALGIYCVATDDCKIVFNDITNALVKFVDCDTADCTQNTITVVSTQANKTVGKHLAIFCPATDNCKITYFEDTNNDLEFFDCDTATCSTGTNTTIDSTGAVGQFSSIYCVTSTDCKISYKKAGACGTAGNCDVKVRDCDDETCSTGNTSVVDSHATADYGNFSRIYCTSSTECKIAHRDATNLAVRFVSCVDGGDAGSYPCNGAGEVTTTVVENTATDLGKNLSLYCPANNDCKLSYRDETVGGNLSNDLKFVDCGDANCSSGNTIQLLDGNTGCTLTNCSTSADEGRFPSMSCLTATDCKIAYRESAGDNLKFADCDDATCSTGQVNAVDSIGDVSDYAQMFCVAADDCKIAYCEAFQVTIADCEDGNVKFADCDNATCTTATIHTLDGNKIINGTLGSVTTTRVFGTTAGDTYTLVSDVQYPTSSSDGTLGTGTYTLHLHFTNNITSGTETWHYHVGYCTVSDNCATKTVHVTSADQSYTSATTSPQTPTVVASSSLTIPAPAKSKWIYIELHATSVATGTIGIKMNNTEVNTADTNILIPALTP